MKKYFLLFLVVAAHSYAEIIVLKNGKIIVCEGTYSLHDEMVVFKNKKGQLVQLPIKAVDLEKTIERNKNSNQGEGINSEQASKPEGMGNGQNSGSGNALVDFVEKEKTLRDPGAPIVFEKNSRASRSQGQKPGSGFNEGSQGNILELSGLNPPRSPEEYRSVKKKLSNIYFDFMSRLESANTEFEKIDYELKVLKLAMRSGDSKETEGQLKIRKLEKAWYQKHLLKSEIQSNLFELKTIAEKLGVTDYKDFFVDDNNEGEILVYPPNTGEEYARAHRRLFKNYSDLKKQEFQLLTALQSAYSEVSEGPLAPSPKDAKDEVHIENMEVKRLQNELADIEYLLKELAKEAKRLEIPDYQTNPDER